MFAVILISTMILFSIQTEAQSNCTYPYSFCGDQYDDYPSGCLYTYNCLDCRTTTLPCQTYHCGSGDPIGPVLISNGE